MTADEQKRAVGEAAAALVENGMTVGLGTGTTAAFFVEALARRQLDLRCVSTSNATADLAVRLGLKVIDLDDVGVIDLTVDGADEIAPDLSLIKGAGAAMLREKLVWESSRRCVAIADASKRSDSLGRAPLPIEVVSFGHATTAKRLSAALQGCGIDIEPKLRLRDDAPLITDGGNVIYDAACGYIPDPAALGVALKAVTGVVEHGLFIGLAERALLATDEGVVTLHPR